MESHDKMLLSSREAAKRLSISERTLWTLTKKGMITCIRIGWAKRYSVRELEDFITRQHQIEAEANKTLQSPTP